MPKKIKFIATKLNILSGILIILLCITLLLGHEQICAFIYPSYLNQYRDIMGDKTKNFRKQKLSIGDMINFQFKENRKSLGEMYAITDVKFIPDNQNRIMWKGVDKPPKWNSDIALIENMQRFRIKFRIPVPRNEALEGQTIKGTLHCNLSYPILEDYTRKISSLHSEEWEKSIGIHIFTKSELNILSILSNKMLKIWLICIALFFLPLSIIFLNYLKAYQKARPAKIE